MKKEKQRGFGIIEAIVVVVILAVIGVIGFYVYNANQNKQAKNDSAQQETDPNEGYLVIKEWGVRLKTGPLTADAEYVIKNDNTAWLTTAAYVSKVGGAHCKADGSTGQLLRGKAGYDYNGMGSKIEDFSYTYTDASGKSVKVTAVKVGEYYYAWQGPQAGCVEPTAANVAIMGTYQAALGELATTVEAVPAE